MYSAIHFGKGLKIELKGLSGGFELELLQRPEKPCSGCFQKSSSEGQRQFTVFLRGEKMSVRRF